MTHAGVKLRATLWPPVRLKTIGPASWVVRRVPVQLPLPAADEPSGGCRRSLRYRRVLLAVPVHLSLLDVGRREAKDHVDLFRVRHAGKISSGESSERQGGFTSLANGKTGRATGQSCRTARHACRTTRHTYFMPRHPCFRTKHGCRVVRKACFAIEEACRVVREACHVIEEACRVVREACLAIEEACFVIRKACRVPQ